MKNKNFIEKFTQRPILVFIVMLKDLKDIIMDTLNIITQTTIPQPSFDWFDFIIKLIIAIALWLVLKSYYKIQKRIRVDNLVLSVRNWYFFKSQFDNIEYYKSPNETQEQFIKRLPEGQFKVHLKKEYEEVKNILSKEFDIKPSEAEKLISDSYYWHTRDVENNSKPNKNEPDRNK